MPNDISIPQLDQLPDLTWREKLAYLVWRMLQGSQAECPVEHSFKDGVYTREMKIPAGVLFIGRAHRYGHECQLISGTVVHVTPMEKTVIEAPFTLHTTPGYQMVLYTMTDIVGRSLHPDQGSRDTQWLEDDIFESVDSLKQLGSQIHHRLGAA